MLDETRLAHDSLTSLSEQTGGFAVVRQNDFDGGMRRIVDAKSRYYLLGYYPSLAERDGRFRRIEVRVKRRGTRVEARKGYVASSEETVTPSVVSPELVRLVASPVPEDGIRLRVVAAPIYLARERVTVPVVVEADITGFRFTEEEGKRRDRVEVYIEARDGRGVAAGPRHNALDLVLRHQDHARMLTNGLRYLALLQLPPGAYQLRIGVYEHGAGLGGSVVSELEVPRPSCGLQISPLLVSSRLESKVSVVSRKEDRERLPLLPSPQRAFGSCDEISTYAEMGGRVSYPVEVETLVRNAEGKVVSQSSERLKEPSAARSNMDLSKFQVGSHLLEVRALASDGRRAEQKLPFQVTGLCEDVDAPVSGDYLGLLETYRSGDYDAARRRLSRWNRLALEGASQLDLSSPNIRAAILLHGEMLVFSGGRLAKSDETLHLETAEVLLERLTESDGVFERDWRLLMACYYHGVDLERSKQLLKRAERRFPEDARIQFTLGVTEEVAGWLGGEKLKLSRAAKYYRQALDLDPSSEEAHLRLGRINRNDRNNKDAEKEWLWLVEHSDDARLVYVANMFLGDLHKEFEQWAEAVDAYRAAVEARPAWQLARLSLSQALHVTGRWQEARDVVVRAVELPVSEPEYLDAYRLYYVGLLHWVPELLERLRREVEP